MADTTASIPDSSVVRIAGVEFRQRELLLIPAFWALMAVFVSANRLLDPRGEGMRNIAPNAPVILAFAEAFLWACLTPVVFWVVSRFSVERTGRVLRVLLFIALGALVVVLVDSALDYVRQAVFPPPPRRVGRGAFRAMFYGGPLRFSLLNDVVTYLGVLSAGIARDISMRYRARRLETLVLQAELTQARLDALRRQLDPHFLFNTLNAISSLVERDPRGVRKMIARLSELLRHSISSASEQEVTLDEELHVVERYLEIMKIRFQGRVQVEVEVDPSVRRALVPTFAIQPLVENAFKHGIERIEGAGRVTLTAARDADSLVVRVADNGPGLATTPAAEGTGVGLSNTRSRLRELHGERATLSLSAGVPGGAVAELRLPFREATESRARRSA